MGGLKRRDRPYVLNTKRRNCPYVLNAPRRNNKKIKICFISLLKLNLIILPCMLYWVIPSATGLSDHSQGCHSQTSSGVVDMVCYYKVM